MKKKALIALSFIFLLSLLSAIAIAQGKEANVSLNVERMEDATPLFTVIVLAIVFVILLFLSMYLLRHIVQEQKKKKALKEKISDPDETEYREEHEDVSEFSADTELDKYLKEDERNVVSILRQRGGVCSQSTLRIAGDFSKATLSRLLKELEERNIIRKEKRGKKNLVILK